VNAPEKKSGIVECPHCYTRVIARDDGSCPACGENTGDLSGTNPNETIVTVTPCQKLPDCCMLCGQSGTKHYQIGGTSGDDITMSISASIVGFIAALFTGFGFFSLPRDDMPFSVKIPLCSRCARPLPRPIHIDTENYQMRFLAHIQFRAEMERIT